MTSYLKISNWIFALNISTNFELIRNNAKFWDFCKARVRERMFDKEKDEKKIMEMFTLPSCLVKLQISITVSVANAIILYIISARYYCREDHSFLKGIAIGTLYIPLTD